MTLAEQMIAIFGFAFAAYGIATLATLWTFPSPSRFRILAPFLWKGSRWLPGSKFFATVLACYFAFFGLFIGCQATGSHILGFIFAVPAIIFGCILVGQAVRAFRITTDA